MNYIDINEQTDFWSSRCPYLLISIKELLISIIHLLISIIHLLISIIHLLISTYLVSFIDINNSFIDINNSFIDININFIYINNSFIDINNSFIDINNSFIDINNSFIDINNSFIDINNSFIDINKYGLNVKTAAHKSMLGAKTGKKMCSCCSPGSTGFDGVLHLLQESITYILCWTLSHPGFITTYWCYGNSWDKSEVPSSVCCPLSTLNCWRAVPCTLSFTAERIVCLWFYCVFCNICAICTIYLITTALFLLIL